MPSIHTRIDTAQHQLHRRKALRERHRRRHEGHKAQREAKAVRDIRARIARLEVPQVQFDAVTLANVPPRPEAVAAYLNGSYANVAEARERFPDARLTTISVRSSEVGDVLDVELGDATPADCPAYYHRFKALHPHGRPVFYTFAGQGEQMIAVLAAAGVGREKYVYWSAHWDGKHICSPHTCGYPKADATQWTTHDERVDETLCHPSYWDRG